jgi:hypothetical protein
MRKSIAALAVLGIACAAPPATATDNQYNDPFGKPHRHHVGERCNPHKRPPSGFRCKRTHGKYRLAKRHR